MTVVPVRLLDAAHDRIRPFVLGTIGTVAMLMAVEGLSRVRVPITSDWGLVAVLPTSFWLGLMTLHVVFVVALAARRLDPVLMAFLVALLVVLLYATPALVDSVPRLEVSWRHLGIAEELSGARSIDPSIDAYFNWPGFFAGVATVLDLTTVSATQVALVAPVLNGLLWTFGVVAVVSSLTPSRRHVWLAAWMFAVLNWIDQDYLSPQALAFTLYLVVLVLLLRYLGAEPRRFSLLDAARLGGVRHGLLGWWQSRVPVEHDPRRRVTALLLAVGFAVVMLVSHQLSPFMLLGAATLLALSGRLWVPRLPLLLGLLAVLWLATGASFYLAGHPVLFVQEVGQATEANVVQRVAGSPGHLHVVQTRIGLTGVALALAALGWWRMRRLGSRDLRPALLLAFPFAMVPVQSYGGEMLMRSMLFSLPFISYYAAGLFLGDARARDFRARPLVALVAGVASVAVLTGHYGNAAFDTFTPAEVRGVDQLYRVAPPGSLLVAVTHASSWKSQGYADYHYAILTDDCLLPLDARECYEVLRDRAFHSPNGAFLFVTRAQKESLRLRGDAAPGVLEEIQRLLMSRAGATVIPTHDGIHILRIGPWEHRS